MTGMNNYPSSISINNHIDIYPLNDSGVFYQVDEKDNIFIFGTNHIFKLRLKNLDIYTKNRYFNFEDWISYVIHAGICLLNTSAPELNLRIGISLKDYYQNYADFSCIISAKKVKFLFNGNIKSKPIYIRKCDIFPNLYGQALLISENNNLDNFVVINFNSETLEGVYFEKDKPFLSQRYVLGVGFIEFIHHQDTMSHFDTEHLWEELRNNENHQFFDLFYIKYFKKKIEFICKNSVSKRIFYVETDEVSQAFHVYLKKKLSEFGRVDSIYDGSKFAANGLFGINTGLRSNATDNISISIFPYYSTFIM